MSPANAATASVGPIDVENGYTVGNINGQNGWTKTGAYDVEVENVKDYPAAAGEGGAASYFTARFDIGTTGARAVDESALEQVLGVTLTRDASLPAPWASPSAWCCSWAHARQQSRTDNRSDL